MDQGGKTDLDPTITFYPKTMLSAFDLYSMRLDTIAKQFRPEQIKERVDWHFEEMKKWAKEGKLRYYSKVEGPMHGWGLLSGLRARLEKSVSVEYVTDVDGADWLMIKW
jgi:hypothetical protein